MTRPELFGGIYDRLQAAAAALDQIIEHPESGMTKTRAENARRQIRNVAHELREVQHLLNMENAERERQRCADRGAAE